MTCTAPPPSLAGDRTLVSALIEHRAHEPACDPEHDVLSLIGTIGELSCTVSASDAGSGRWQLTGTDLHRVLITVADLAAHYGVPPYEGDVWPDGTAVGGDGVHLHLAEASPHRLLVEVIEAVGWVAEWVLDPDGHHTLCSGTDRHGRDRAWLAAVPVTELLVRTWCLADRLGVRETLRDLIRQDLASQL